MDLHDLYSRYAADVHRFARYLGGEGTLADDLTSETFHRAWSSASPIRETTVKACLFTKVTLERVRRFSHRRTLLIALAMGTLLTSLAFSFDGDRSAGSCCATVRFRRFSS